MQLINVVGEGDYALQCGFEEYYSPLAKIKSNIYNVINNYPMPRLDKKKMALAKKEVKKIKEKNKKIVFYGGELFEWVTNVRGTEQFFLDLYLNKNEALNIQLIDNKKNKKLLKLS